MEIRKSKQMFETIVVEYIADDGTRFSTEETCVAYEKKKHVEKELEKVKTKPEADGCMNIDGDQIHYLDSGYAWYFPTNAQDIKAIREYYEVNREIELDEYYIGEWICIEDDGYEARMTTLARGIEYAKHLLNKFGYDVVKMEGELK